LIKSFLAFFVGGVAATLIGAHFYPLPEPVLIYSQTSALANGGREEVFSIRLPDDRLGSPRAATTAAFPQQTFVSEGQNRILAELFRVRDTEGRVVGLATRMNGQVPGLDVEQEAVTDWMLLLPSRGALMMSRGSLAAGDELEFEADRMGFSFTNSGSVVSGTGDFAELSGFYSETTAVERVDEEGQVHGVVTLTTRLRAAAK